MFGIEELYSELLLEAKTPEQIKNIYTYQFVNGKNVPMEILDRIFNIDPTSKKSFTKWVLLQYNGNEELIDDIINNGTLKRLFEYFKERAGNGLKIMDYTIKEAINMLPYEDPILSPKPEGWEDDPKYNYEIRFETDEWVIAVPYTYEAEKHLGQGCRWCTAGAFGNGIGFWEDYSSEGTLWVNFDKRKSEVCPMDNKEYPYTRYQFLFEHTDIGEMMDSHDNRINLEEANIPEEVIEFYEEQEEWYGEILRGERSVKTWEEYEEERLENSIFYLTGFESDFRLLYEFNDEEPVLNPDVQYIYAYGNGDYHDPINYCSFIEDNFLYDYSYNSDIKVVLLKPASCDPMCYFEQKKGYHYNWVGYDLIKHFVLDDNHLFVCYEDSREYVYMISTSSGNFELNDCGSKNIVDARIVKPNIELPSDYIFIQVTNDDGVKSLYVFDEYNEEGYLRIPHDLTDGDTFTFFENEEGAIFIHGKFQNYLFNTDEYEYDEENGEIEHDFYEKLPCNGYKFICKKRIGGDVIFYLYDAEKKEIKIDNIWDYDICYNGILAVKNNSGFLYDLNTCSPLTKDIYYSIEKKTNCIVKLLSQTDDNNTLVSFYDLSKRVLYGPFCNSTQITNNSYLVEKDRNHNSSILNFDTGKISEYEFNSKSISKGFCEGKILLIKGYDDKFYFINGINGNIIQEAFTDEIRIFFDYEFFALETKDKTWNMYSLSKGLLYEFDELIGYNMDYCVIKKLNKIYILHFNSGFNVTIVEPKNGFDTTYIENIKISNLSINILTLYIKYNDKNYECYWDLYRNEMSKIIDNNEGKFVRDEKTKSLIDSLLFSNHNVISENFKNFMNRLNKY